MSFAALPQTDVHEEDVPLSISTYKVPSLFKQKPCKKCGALRFPTEQKKAMFCCKNGKIDLPKPEMPEKLKDLLQNNKDFLNNIRLYNNSFCLATFGVDGRIKDEWSTFQIYLIVSNKEDIMIIKRRFS